MGSDEDVLEQAIVGAGVGIITDPGRLSNYVYDFGVLQAPYIASDYDEVLKLFETDTYNELCTELQNQGFNDAGIQVVDCDVEAFKTACDKAYEDLNYTEIKAKIDAELGR